MHDQALSPGEFNLLPQLTAPAAAGEPLAIRRTVLFPNPVREVAQFRVEGAAVASIKVQIYDLTGTRVFDSDWQPGDLFEWDATDHHGRTLANGVYLYTLAAQLVSGQQIPFAPQKLFILRSQ